jgi:antirestriction protein
MLIHIDTVILLEYYCHILTCDEVIKMQPLDISVSTVSTPRIYVRCLTAYNSGKLHGKWIDANQNANSIREEIREVLHSSPEHDKFYPCEEWAIHDYEYMPDLGENPSIEKVADVAKFIAEHGDLGEAVIEHFCGSIDDAKVAMENYHGTFNNDEDFAMYWVLEVECREIPDYLSHYIDYASMGHDMLINDFYSIESGNKIHVFLHH